MATTAKTTFRRMLKEYQQEWLIVPIIRAELLNPKFRGFNLKVEGFTPRPYDGKFHPSTHATWTARQLALYLTNPEMLEEESLTLTSVLAITQGKFWHLFVQKLLLRHGILLRAEVPLADPKTNVVGHMDGLVCTYEGFEFKTMNDWKHDKVKTWQDFRELEPAYYAQAQDYLRITNLSAMRVVIMGMSNPYPMTEVVVPADDITQIAQRRKYQLAMELAADGEMGEQCCNINSTKSTSCAVRLACPIGSKV
jgi:hypothetical protein